MSGLCLACSNGHTVDTQSNENMIKFILSKQPNLNYADRFGRTALHHAINTHNNIAVRLLL